VFTLTASQVVETTMLPATLEEIRVAGAFGRSRLWQDRPLADKGYPSRANRSWLRERGIAPTIPERDDQIAHRRKRPGLPIDFRDQQRPRYRAATSPSAASTGSSRRGIAMRSDKTARNQHSGLCLAAALHWHTTNCFSTGKQVGPHGSPASVAPILRSPQATNEAACRRIQAQLATENFTFLPKTGSWETRSVGLSEKSTAGSSIASGRVPSTWLVC
jgi:hypothetical protein